MNHDHETGTPGGTGRSGDGQPPEAWLGHLLRQESARHEPDVDRILARMSGAPHADQELAGQELADRETLTAPLAHRAHGWTRRARGRTHSGRVAWPLAAAGVAVVTVATVAAAHVLTSPPDRGASTANPAVASSPSSSLNTAMSIGPSPSGTATAPRSAPATGAPPNTRTSAPTTTAASPLGRAVSIAVSPTPWTTHLTLPVSGHGDWIAVGARSDGQLVRAKNPTRALGSVTVSGYGPSVVDGPYQLSWTGGAPEQQRATDVSWQSITAVDGRLRITVPLKGDRFTVDLYAGTVKTTGRVQVEAPSSAGTVSAALAPCTVDVCADIVSVTVDSALLPGGGTSGDLVIDLGPAQPGVGLGLGLAAVVLR